jgi:hypothetical protein
MAAMGKDVQEGKVGLLAMKRGILALRRKLSDCKCVETSPLKTARKRSLSLDVTQKSMSQSKSTTKTRATSESAITRDE